MFPVAVIALLMSITGIILFIIPYTKNKRKSQ